MEPSPHAPDRTAVHGQISAGNPIESAPDGLATPVSTPGRVRSSLRWTRDRGASVSNRSLTLTPVTLSYSARPLLSRNGRGFRGPFDDLHTAFPLQKNSLFYL